MAFQVRSLAHSVQPHTWTPTLTQQRSSGKLKFVCWRLKDTWIENLLLLEVRGNLNSYIFERPFHICCCTAVFVMNGFKEINLLVCLESQLFLFYLFSVQGLMLLQAYKKSHHNDWAVKNFFFPVTGCLYRYDTIFSSSRPVLYIAHIQCYFSLYMIRTIKSEQSFHN